MGLGKRNAHARHEQGVAIEAARSEDYWDFTPGQHVMTSDGFPGVVASVEDGPHAGNEHYIVELDNGMGGGAYRSSNLRAMPQQTASVEHTAADDYPELGSVLVDHPDPAQEIVTLSSLAKVAKASCPSCGYFKGDGGPGACPMCNGPLKSDQADSQPHQEESTDCPSCGFYSGSGYTKNGGCPSCGADHVEHHTASYDPENLGDSTDLDNSGIDNTIGTEYQENFEHPKVAGQFGDTTKNFPTGPSHDIDNKTFESCKPCGGSGKGYFGETCGSCGGSRQQRAASLDTDHFSNYSRGLKEGHDAHSDDFARLTDGGMLHNHCEEKHEARYHSAHEPSQGISFHELRTKLPHGSTCDECMDHITEPREHSESECEYGGDGDDSDCEHKDNHLPENHPLHDHFGSQDDLDAEKADQSHWEDTYHQRKADEGSAEHQIDEHFSQPEHQDAVKFLDHNDQGPSHYSMLVEAADDPDFRFHITASWSDVQAKATMLRKEGRVKIVVANASLVSAEVKGEHHVYETQLQYAPASRKVAIWTCGCKWGAYSWGRSGRWKRYEGRMCSHALATNYEMQSRGMFGKTPQSDTERPSWQKAHSPVVVEYDKTDQKNLTRRAVPPGNMRKTFGCLADESPLTTLVRESMSQGDDPAEIVLAMTAARIDAPQMRFQAAVTAGQMMDEEDPGGGNGAGPDSGEDEEEQMGDGTGMGIGGLGNAATGSLHTAGWSQEQHPQPMVHVMGQVPPRPLQTGDKVMHPDSGFTDTVTMHAPSQLQFEQSGTMHRAPIEGDDSGVIHGITQDHVNDMNVGNQQERDFLATNPTGPSKYSALDDEAMFEPDMPHEGAFLAALPELMEAGGAAEGAAGAEEGGGGVSDLIKSHMRGNQNTSGGQEGHDTDPPEVNGGAGPNSVGEDGQIHFGTWTPVPEGALPETDGEAGGPPSNGGGAGNLEGDQGAGVVDPETTDVSPVQGEGAVAASLHSNNWQADVAAQAKAFLAKTSMKEFSPAEQAQIIHEGGDVRAANLDRLEITGTHYEALEHALASGEEDDEWY